MLCIKGLHLCFFSNTYKIFLLQWLLRKKNYKFCISYLLSHMQLEYNSVFLLFSCPVDINYMKLTMMNTNQELQGWMGHPPIQSNTP